MVGEKLNIKRLVLSTLVVMGLCIGLVPAQTASAEAPHYPLGEGVRFYSQHICVLKHSDAADWPVATAAYYFNSVGNVDLVTRTEGQGCGSYPYTQILHVRGANLGSTGPCVRKDGTGFYYPTQYADFIYGTANDPNHTYRSVTAYLNHANPYCRDTATKRSNTTSKGIGSALGLSIFSEQVDHPSVMYDSSYSNARVPWATGYDRNGLYYLYLQKLD